MKVSNIFLVIRAFFSGVKLKDFFSIGSNDQKKKKRSIAVKAGKGLVAVLLWLCMIIGFGSFMMMFGFTFYSVESLGHLTGHGAGLSVVLATFASSLMVFIFGFMTGTDVLYKGKDIALLRSLPLTEGEVISSRILILLVYLIPIHLAIVIPALVVFFIVNPFSLASITGSLIVLLVTPLVPAALSCILTMTTCRVGGRGPGKLVVQMVVFCAMLVLLSLFQVGGMQYFSANLSMEDISNMGGLIAFLSVNVDKVLRFVPTCLWLAGSLVPSSALLDSVLSIVFGFAVFALTSWLLSVSYVNLASSFEAGDARSRKSKTKNVQPEYRRRSVMTALALRDWDIIRGSSSFLFELIGESVVPLLLMTVYGIMGLLDDISMGVGMLSQFDFFPLIVCAVLLLMQGVDMISSTSASREGKTFPLNRVYPVDGMVYVKAKLVVHLIATAVPYAIYCVMALALFRMSIWHIAWMLPLGFAFSVAMCFEGLAIDFNKPFLTWKNPQQAVKQNANGLKSMGLALFQLLILGGGFYLLDRFIGLLAGAGWIAACLAVMLIVSWHFVSKAAEAAYN